MPAIYHPGVIQFAVHYDIGAAHDAVNVLYYQSAGSGFTTAALTIQQTAFNTAFRTIFDQYAAAGTFYKGVIVTDMSSNTGLQVDNSTYTPHAPPGGGTPMSDGTALLVSLHTAIRYRGGHGRVYLPGVSISSVGGDGRTVTGSTISSINSSWVALNNAMIAIVGSAGGPLNQIVWHKHLSTASNTTENVLAAVAQPILATQRRRLRKVSRHRRA